MSEGDKRQYKDELYGQFARIGKALSSPRRLEAIDLLAQGEKPVESLAAEAQQSMANMSQHLQVLRNARLVEARREGARIYYRLADPRVFKAWQAIRDLGEAQLAEIDRLVESLERDEDELEPIEARELLQLLQRDEVLLIDVRPAQEFQAGHIRGARSIPLTELERRLAEIDDERQVVAYCRGPYCLFADEAVEMLCRRGISARRLREGYPDWLAAGHAVQR